MKVLTRNQMYACDKEAIDVYKIPSLLLMEHAGYRIAKELIDKIFLYHGVTKKSRIVVLCGSGNNGGDGMVVARWLNHWGYNVCYSLLDTDEQMSKETRVNYEMCIAAEVPLVIQSESATFMYNEISECEVIIDSIYGIGYHDPMPPFKRDIIDHINNQNKLVIAIDIASGIDADTGKVECAIKANTTITVGAYKAGHFIGKGHEYSGNLTIVDIGIPQRVFAESNYLATLITEENIALPIRDKYSHKGMFGRVGIFAGSLGLTGAAKLACEACVKTGAGLVTLFCRKELVTIFGSSLKEVMYLPIDKEEIQTLGEKIKTLDVILIGPGFGTDEYAYQVLKTILAIWKKRIVIDADAINLLSTYPDLQDEMISNQVLLTPHLAEFSRYIKVAIEEVKDNRIELLKEVVAKRNLSILLKDYSTLFCNQEGLWINTTGNDGLSKGGSGDVLAGIITSLLAQGFDIREAATAGSYYLGKTVETISKNKQTRAITATEIINELFSKQKEEDYDKI